jgi:hypothetical protein
LCLGGCRKLSRDCYRIVTARLAVGELDALTHRLRIAMGQALDFPGLVANADRIREVLR